MKAKYALIVLALVAPACDRPKDQGIYNRDPFLTVYMKDPPDGYKGTISRSKRFANIHRMGIEYSTSHFEENEYSAILHDSEINIAVSNVGRNGVTMLSAYSKTKPTPAQMVTVSKYQCFTFRRCI